MGKDAVLAGIKAKDLLLHYAVTVTTRAPRPGEKNAREYYFVSREEFQQMEERGELLEWAEVYGNYYGVPAQPVKQAMERGQDTIFKVDVQGAATLKKILPGAVFIFLVPPSMDELVARLEQRHTELPDELARRLAKAGEEIKQMPLFDYVVINRRDEIDAAVSDIQAIITAEKCRVKPREIIF